MILIIDNYDSFVYNLAQYIGELGGEPVVYRHDSISVDDVVVLAPSHIVISPGPKTPLESGVSNEIIRQFGGKIPILGVCLGHQCIGHVCGATIGRGKPTHGKTSLIYHDGRTIYEGLDVPFEAARYHSLVVVPASVPDCLEVSSRTRDGEIMGLRHKRFVVEGVQFHPESILTAMGHDILRRFLSYSNPLWNGNR